MRLTEVVGFVGAGLAGAAYVPQISHMVRERCVAGLSRPAFLVWFIASALILVRAVATHEAVFVLLGGSQTAATGFISAYVAAHRGCYCAGHARRDPVAGVAPQLSTDHGCETTARMTYAAES